MPGQSLTDTLDDPKFRKLSPAAQRSVLTHYNVSSGMQDQLLQHLAGPSSATPATPPPAIAEPPGFLSRMATGLGLPTSIDEAKQSGQDLLESAVGPAGIAGKAIYGYGKQVYKGAKEGMQEVTDAAKNIRAGQPIGPNEGKAAYGITHAAMQAIPGIGPATETAGEDITSRNYFGAAGGIVAATLQAMMMRGGKGKSPESRINKLTYATGETGSTAESLKHVLPEIDETVAKNGRPKTIGEFQKAVKDTSARLEQRFNSGLFRNAHRQVVPSDIADALESKANEMPPSAEGQAMAAQLKNAATEYRRPWTLRQLNAERMMRNGFTKGFYGKEGSAQMGAMRSSVDTIIDKTVADGTRDVLYDELHKANPRENFRALKQKQSHMIELQDQLDNHVGKLTDAQAARKGQPLLDKATVTASGSSYGVTPRVHGLAKMIPGRGPMSSANTAVEGAFPRTGVSPARAAVLALPVTALTRRGQTIQPPPQPESNEQQPQQ